MKKIIAVLTVLCIAVAVFSACGKDKKSDAQNNSVLYTYDSAYSFEDASIRAYSELCEAVVKGDSEVRMNMGFIDDVLQLYYTSFPLKFIVESLNPSAEGVLSIKYKDEEKHINQANDFISKIASIKEEAEDESDIAYAVKLYSYIALSVKPSANSSVTCYETVMTGEGTSFSYANMFEYLMQQKGIKAYHILCETDSGESKAISAAELGGELYYFDLYSEYEDNGGKLLKFFGMTSEDVKNSGIKSTIYTNKQTAADASDLIFEACRECKSWEIKKNNLLITKNDGNVVQIAL